MLLVLVCSSFTIVLFIISHLLCVLHVYLYIIIYIYIYKELLYELSKVTLEKNANAVEEFIRICQKNCKYDKYQCLNQTKVCTDNYLPFVNKIFSNTIMHMTRFCTKFLESKTDKNKRKYTKKEKTMSYTKKIKKN